MEESRDKNFQIEFVGLETDFEDLQAAISEANDVSVSFIFKKKPSVEEVEHEVNRILSTYRTVLSKSCVITLLLRRSKIEEPIV